MKQESRFIPPMQACETLSVCRNTLMKMAKECGAVVRFGGIVRIDMEKLIANLESNHSGE